MTPFEPFPKIARLNREIVITEKIDGTNAQILIEPEALKDHLMVTELRTVNGLLVYAGSRNRWLKIGEDNFGFAAWVYANAEALVEILGPGRHYGEWWGAGVGRRYGQQQKRFSVFNVERWKDLAEPAAGPRDLVTRVPTLYKGPWFDLGPTGTMLPVYAPKLALARLRDEGSVAAPGFMKPEGIVVFHTAGNVCFKVTLENDESPKGQTE